MPITDNNITNNINNIVGADGVVPVMDPSARWCWWNVEEIFIGTVGANRYIPKVNDYVMDSDNYTTYIVTAVDPTTLLSTLLEIKPSVVTTAFSNQDILFGVGPGTQSDTYRVYLDKSVVPFIMAVDARLKVGGSMCSYAKIFKGADVSNSGKVISRLYNQTGTLLSENIPLELAAVDSHTNHSIKTVSVCYTGESLTDGELVTIVFYSDQGNVVSKRQLLVENTSFIRSLDASRKYISGISLDSPFITPTVDGIINFPLNVPLQAFNFMGIVHYSDGSTLKLPVDGTKFKLLGIDQYISTIVGQKIDLVLSYSLNQDETVYGSVTSDSKYVTAPYSIITTKTDGSYMVKLFGYPVWVNQMLGYRMQWYLYNLERNAVYDVTPSVTYGITTPAFDPIAYGILQRLVVMVNLKDVSGSFKSYIHTQTIDVVLKYQGEDPRTNWLVGFEANTLHPLFGEGLSVKVKTNSVNISCNIINYLEWLDKVYEQTYPIIDRSIEVVAPRPNFFALVYNGNRYEFPIDQWDNDLPVGVVPQLGNTVFVQFFKRTPNADIQLSVAGLIVK